MRQRVGSCLISQNHPLGNDVVLEWPFLGVILARRLPENMCLFHVEARRLLDECRVESSPVVKENQFFFRQIHAKHKSFRMC